MHYRDNPPRGSKSAPIDIMGSGTTIIAAERTRRRGYGFAVDPLDVDAAIRRREAITEGSGRHAETGLTFAEHARALEVPLRRKGNRDYDVGYGKPPVHSRFKKGQSG